MVFQFAISLGIELEADVYCLEVYSTELFN